MIGICLFLLLLSVGLLLGAVYGHPMVGIVSGIFAFIGIASCYFGCCFLWSFWQPYLPVCTSGKCKNEDYKFIEASEIGRVYACKCGMKYIIYSDKRHFKKILPDGMIINYLMRSRFGRWKPEERKEG